MTKRGPESRRLAPRASWCQRARAPRLPRRSGSSGAWPISSFSAPSGIAASSPTWSRRPAEGSPWRLRTWGAPSRTSRGSSRSPTTSWVERTERRSACGEELLGSGFRARASSQSWVCVNRGYHEDHVVVTAPEQWPFEGPGSLRFRAPRPARWPLASGHAGVRREPRATRSPERWRSAPATSWARGACPRAHGAARSFSTRSRSFSAWVRPWSRRFVSARFAASSRAFFFRWRFRLTTLLAIVRECHGLPSGAIFVRGRTRSRWSLRRA
jgi:hypothetical protein